MSRHERGFQPDAGARLGMEEMLHLLGADDKQDPEVRQQAIACFLSADEGWRDAVKALGGAFAEDEAGLKERKAD